MPIRLFLNSAFQYMLLLRGATIELPEIILFYRFQYMLLLRGATFRGLREPCFGQVSIHAPLARSNSIAVFGEVKFEFVSIHAPLARSNALCMFISNCISVSIHAPLARSNR